MVVNFIEPFLPAMHDRIGIAAKQAFERSCLLTMKPLYPPAHPAARLLTLGAGALLLWLGILQGGYRDTLAKAVRICLECVGIG